MYKGVHPAMLYSMLLHAMTYCCMNSLVQNKWTGVSRFNWSHKYEYITVCTSTYLSKTDWSQYILVHKRMYEYKLSNEHSIKVHCGMYQYVPVQRGTTLYNTVHICLKGVSKSCKQISNPIYSAFFPQNIPLHYRCADFIFMNSCVIQWCKPMPWLRTK